MNIDISGKNIEVGEALHQYIEEHLQEVMTKYLDRVTSVHAVVSKEKHRFRVDIAGNLGTHSKLVVKSATEGEDVYPTFDAALAKVEKQLRRYKRRITDHHKQNNGDQVGHIPTKAVKYVLTPEYSEQEDESASQAAIIAEKPTSVDILTVSEAVMRMDLEDLPALLFFNASHGRLNVVYRRNDGNISWVDPEQQSASVAA